MNIIAVIPARYASTRLPGKPLVDICGKPMIQHVYERVSEVSFFNKVIVATDDERIVAAVEKFGGTACMTSSTCASGSDRLIEVANQYIADIYINIQGDEPLIEPDSISKLAKLISDNQEIQVATLCYPITSEQAQNKNTVKVVRNNIGDALYFSRNPIPFPRDNDYQPQFLGHLGIYAYRRKVLLNFSNLPFSELENTEKLEQLRLLEAGINIRVLQVKAMGPGVDTIEDLEEVRAIIAGASSPTIGNKNTSKDISKIKLIITDVDGVLTDGGLYYGENGECIKRFHAQDGLGISMLQNAGIKIAILSGRDCPALRRRLADLNINLFMLGQKEKKKACIELIEKAGVSASEAIFVGDDLPDLDGFSACAFGVAVGNARQEVKKQAAVILKDHGGHGAFRELADMFLNKKFGE